MDGYSNHSGFPLTYADQIAYNSWMASEAHDRNLSVGLKNGLEQVADLLALYDWELNEQCFQFEECNLLQPFVAAGKAVFGVEYSGATDSFCPQANAMRFDWLKKNLNLDAWRQSCRSYALDVDASGTEDALSDGLLVIRYLFGFRGTALIADAVGAGCKRCTAQQIEAHLAQMVTVGELDIDLDSRQDALTDGLLVIRYQFGFSGDALIQDAVGADCSCCTANAIVTQLQAM